MTDSQQHVEGADATPTETDAVDIGDNAEEPVDSEPDDRAHLEDVEDGCGCEGMWEHLSEQREE